MARIQFSANTCQCGCGAEVRDGNKFLNGHNKRIAHTPAWFWSKVDRSGGPKACWPWTAGGSDEGYGGVFWEGKAVGAHCVAYFLKNGCWAKPMCLHTCDNKPCCNPDHLYAGTAKQNSADAWARGQSKPPIHSTAMRMKMSIAMRGNRNAVGPKSLAHRAALSAAKKGCRGTFEGKTHTETTKAKIREAALKQWADWRRKHVS
jgi:hypothetical protein